MARARGGLFSSVCIDLDPRDPDTDLGAGRAFPVAEDAVGDGSLAAKGADSEPVWMDNEALLDAESDLSDPSTEANGNPTVADLGTEVPD